MAIGTAFAAGLANFLKENFVEGDPDDYLHTRGHEHCSREWRAANRDGWRHCIHCNPPVHGIPVLVQGGTRTPPTDRARESRHAGRQRSSR